MTKPTNRTTKKASMSWPQFILNAIVIIGIIAGWIYFGNKIREAAFENVKRAELREAAAKSKSLTK